MAEQILTDKLKAEIDALDRYSMARLIRFAPIGHKYFVNGTVHDYFIARFKSLGGWSPELSKEVGHRS